MPHSIKIIAPIHCLFVPAFATQAWPSAPVWTNSDPHLYDRCSHLWLTLCKATSVMSGKGKKMGRQQVVFSTLHDFPEWPKQPRNLGWQVGYVLNHCWSRYVVRRPWRYPRITWGASLDGASCVLSIPLLMVASRSLVSHSLKQSLTHTHTWPLWL